MSGKLISLQPLLSMYATPYPTWACSQSDAASPAKKKWRTRLGCIASWPQLSNFTIAVDLGLLHTVYLWSRSRLAGCRTWSLRRYVSLQPISVPVCRWLHSHGKVAFRLAIRLRNGRRVKLCDGYWLWSCRQSRHRVKIHVPLPRRCPCCTMSLPWKVQSKNGEKSNWLPMPNCWFVVQWPLLLQSQSVCESTRISG